MTLLFFNAGETWSVLVVEHIRLLSANSKPRLPSNIDKLVN